MLKEIEPLPRTTKAELAALSLDPMVLGDVRKTFAASPTMERLRCRCTPGTIGMSSLPPPRCVNPLAVEVLAMPPTRWYRRTEPNRPVSWPNQHRQISAAPIMRQAPARCRYDAPTLLLFARQGSERTRGIAADSHLCEMFRPAGRVLDLALEPAGITRDRGFPGQCHQTISSTSSEAKRRLYKVPASKRSSSTGVLDLNVLSSGSDCHLEGDCGARLPQRNCRGRAHGNASRPLQQIVGVPRRHLDGPSTHSGATMISSRCNQYPAGFGSLTLDAHGIDHGKMSARRMGAYIPASL